MDSDTDDNNSIDERTLVNEDDNSDSPLQSCNEESFDSSVDSSPEDTSNILVPTTTSLEQSTTSNQGASTSSGGAITTSNQDLATSIQEPSCSSLVSVRSRPRSVFPVGGSVNKDTAHVSRQASGDEVLELVGAFVNEADKSEYDCTIERRGGRQSKEVHVHLTKTDIHEPKAVTFGGDVCIGTPPQMGNTEPAGPPSQLKSLRNKTERTFKSWTERMVMTKAATTTLDKISMGRSWVTVTGCPGEGKTTAGYLVLKHLHDRGREVFDIKTPDDYFIAKEVGQSVILLNDIFGALTFDSDSFKKWQSVLSDVLALSEHKQDFRGEIHMNKSQNKPEVTVILVSRLSILREAGSRMGKFKQLVLKDDNMVDLTGAVEMEETERIKIWKCHAEQYGIDIESRIVREVCNMELSYGFPHCCRLFAAMYKKNNSLNMKHFFLKPLEFLNQSMETIIMDSVTGPLVRQMLRNDGCLDLENVQDHEQIYQYSSIAKLMKGTYFVLNDRKIEFHHPSVYDSAAFLICQIDPQFVISFCSLSFLNERVRLNGLTQSSLIQCHQTIHIDSNFEKELLERFLKEIQASNISGVLSHASFHDEDFVSKFMDNILPSASQSSSFRSIRDLLNLHDKHTNKSFLFLMTKSGSDKILRYIHQYLELTEEEQSEALFGVCEHTSVSSLQYLLQKYKDINLEVTDSDNQTPLLVATKRCSHDMISTLLTRNVNVNALDNQGYSPLLNICSYGVDDDGSVVKMLLEKGAFITPQSPLCFACKAGHLNVVKALLDEGVNVNETDGEGKTALVSVCSLGYLDIVTALLEQGADINKTNDKGLTPLTTAFINCNIDIMKVLLDNGADVNEKVLSRLAPFQLACVMGNVVLMTVLLDMGADINKTDCLGVTPLHRACIAGHVDVVTMLLDKEADINKTSDDGSSPLHLSCLNGHANVVSVLLDRNADINKTDDRGCTPLHLACFGREMVTGVEKTEGSVDYAEYEEGHVDTVTVLLDKEADINEIDDCGMTPLHYACLKRHVNVVTVLLDKGADVNIRNNFDKTPLDLAMKEQRTAVQTLLLDRQ